MIEAVPVSGASRRSVADVLNDILGNVNRMIRSEVRLVKAEARDELAAIGTSAPLMVAGAMLSGFSLGFLLLGGFLYLETVAAPWVAALIVGGATALLAALMLAAAFKRIAARPAARENATIPRMEQSR